MAKPQPPVHDSTPTSAPADLQAAVAPTKALFHSVDMGSKAFHCVPDLLEGTSDFNASSRFARTVPSAASTRSSIRAASQEAPWYSCSVERDSANEFHALSRSV